MSGTESSGAGASDGGWPGGWVLALVAGVISGILARWMGQGPMAGAVLLGLGVFVVFGVILGMFWTVPAGHGGHDHGHGDQDHSHAAPVAASLVAPVIPANNTARQPVALSVPRGGKGDDLQMLEGIGPAMEKLCHELGVFHYDQIAGWGEAEVAWMDSNLKGFKGRVTRDKWVRQARLIGEVGLEEFKRRAKTNDY